MCPRLFGARVVLTAMQALLKTIKDWPVGIYDISAVIVAVSAELDRSPSTSSTDVATPDRVILMECLAELWVKHPMDDSFRSFDLPTDIHPIVNLEKRFLSSCVYDDLTCLTLSENTIYSLRYETKYSSLWSSTKSSWRSGEKLEKISISGTVQQLLCSLITYIQSPYVTIRVAIVQADTCVPLDWPRCATITAATVLFASIPGRTVPQRHPSHFGLR